MLCKFCADLEIDKASSEEGATHHRTFAELVECAASGCKICRGIEEEAIERDFSSYDTDNEGDDDESQISCHFNDIGQFLEWRKGTNKYKDPIATVDIFTTDDDGMARIVWARKIHYNVRSQEFFELLHSWMDACESGDHTNCHQVSDMVLPARVIDVGTDDADPFLFLSNGQKATWATLSYCWGDNQPLTTKLATIDDRCERLRLEDMPVLFRDAVVITRRLGYRFLWIDALCIIQDSRSDWETEATNMGYIYKDSSVTIIAEASTDCNVGIFEGTRAGRERTLFEIRSHSTTNNAHGTVQLERNIVESTASRGPVSRRAWTLQEDMLSRRILRFASGQVWWQCNEIQCNERDPFGLDSMSPTSSTNWQSKSPRIILGRNNELFNQPDYSPLQCWYRAVNNFSSRRITYPKDRLPAISGVAKEVYRHTLQHYKAGLWLDDMNLGLLWSSLGPGAVKSGVDAASYVAPSWSWASIDFSASVRPWWEYDDRTIYHFELINHPPSLHVATVLNAEIDTKSGDPFAQVTSGRLRICGPFHRVCSCRVPLQFFDCYTRTATSRVGDHILDRVRFLGSSEILPRPPRMRDCFDAAAANVEALEMKTVDDLPCRDGIDLKHETLYYLHIEWSSYGPNQRAYCLIIKDAADTMEEFERVGMGLLYAAKDTTRLWPT